MAAKRAQESLATIAELLGPAFRKNGLAKEYQHWRIFSLWEKTVGQSIAKHSRPHRFERGVLSVLVASSAWLQELQFMKQEIVERLNRELELLVSTSEPQLRLDALRISGIKFLVGKIVGSRETTNSPRVTRRPEHIEPTPERMAFAEELTAQTTDPELKALFRETLLRVNVRRSAEKK